MATTYRVAIGAVRLGVAVMGWPVHVRGVEHLPRSGPAIIASNHISYLDPVPLALGVRASGRWARFMAKRELFEHRLAGPLLRRMRHICVDRTGDADRAYRTTLDLLRAGELVALYPESTISTSFELGPLKGGAARLALETGAPLVPAATWGGHRLLTKGRRPALLQRDVPLTIHFGPPLRGDGDAGTLTDTLRGALDAQVRASIREYPGLPADATWWVPAALRTGPR